MVDRKDMPKMNVKKSLKRMIAGCMAVLMTITMAPDMSFVAKAYEMSQAKFVILKETGNPSDYIKLQGAKVCLLREEATSDSEGVAWITAVMLDSEQSYNVTVTLDGYEGFSGPIKAERFNHCEIRL